MLIVFFAILLVVVFVLLINYFQSTKIILQDETNQHLKDNAKQVSSALDYRVDIQMERLQTIAYTCQKYREMGEEDDAQEYLQSRALKYKFRYLELLTPDSEMWADYKNTAPFQQSMKGIQEIAYIKESPLDGAGVALYTVPCIVNDQVEAVLVGERTEETVAEILQMDDFAGEGKYIIVDSAGNVVTHSTNVKGMESMEDICKELQNSDSKHVVQLENELQENMAAKKEGSLVYEKDGKNILMNYSPLESVDWFLVSAVEENVLSDKSSMLVRETIAVIALVEVVLIALIILFVKNNKTYNKNLEEVAYIDSVTKGNTKIRFEEFYREAMADTSKQYALITLDVDKFKLINDAFGSEEGDKTLKYIYERLCAHLHSGEIIARVQADIFYILKEFTTQEEIQEEYDQIVEEINKDFNNEKEDAYAYKLVITAGVYVIKNNKTSLITAVDRSTVARKRKVENSDGKTSTCYFYSDEDRIHLLQEKEIINHMEAALLNKEFEVYLQPKCNPTSQEIKGAEALIRWNDPQKGMIYPNDFIPVFEKTGFIVKIDLFVFEQCCQLVKKWIQEGRDPIVISLNLSRVHFMNQNFLNEFIRIREKYQVPAAWFEMEITETVICEDVRNLTQHINRIHQAGFACSMDDFGAGYSSLNILRNVNVDVIKLDRAFFEKASGEKGQIVIESIVELAKKLEMGTVAEGIETFSQVDYLREIQCDLIQGYVFSRPVTIKEFEKKLAEKNR